MKESINFCPFPGTESLLEGWPGGLAGFLRDHGLDGIELQVWDREPYADPFPETVGVHLRHWPFWMDFWLDDRDELARNHPDHASMQRWFMGAENREQWVEAIRANIAASLSYRPEYLVWHVTHCGLDESYHRRFRYSSEQIIDATVELAVQINGKVRGKVTLPMNADKDTALAAVRADEKLFALIDGKTVVKEIVVPNKIINIVVK